jgi:hypothetical protein
MMDDHYQIPEWRLKELAVLCGMTVEEYKQSFGKLVTTQPGLSVETDANGDVQLMVDENNPNLPKKWRVMIARSKIKLVK